jgi:hypothetical protein
MLKHHTQMSNDSEGENPKESFFNQFEGSGSSKMIKNLWDSRDLMGVKPGKVICRSNKR